MIIIEKINHIFLNNLYKNTKIKLLTSSFQKFKNFINKKGFDSELVLIYDCLTDHETKITKFTVVKRMTL